MPKADLIAEAQAKGLTLTGKETVAELQALLETPPTGNNSVPPAPAAPTGRSSAIEEASYNQTVANMKKFLSEQPLVSIFIPLEPGEPKGTLLPVEMNGYKVKVPKNVYVDVPKPIADIVKHSLNVYEEASSSVVSKENGNHLRLDLANGEAKAALNV